MPVFINKVALFSPYVKDSFFCYIWKISRSSSLSAIYVLSHCMTSLFKSSRRLFLLVYLLIIALEKQI